MRFFQAFRASRGSGRGRKGSKLGHGREPRALELGSVAMSRPGTGGRIPVGLSPPLSAVGPPARSNGEHIDHALGIAASEDDAPLADPEAPEALGSTQAPDISVGQRADGRSDALAITPAEPPQRLERGWADLDPPAGRFNQSRAPPRPGTTPRRARG